MGALCPSCHPCPQSVGSGNLVGPRKGRTDPDGKGVWPPVGFHPAPDLTWLHGVSGKVTGMLKTGHAGGRAPRGTLQPFAPCPRASVGSHCGGPGDSFWLLDSGCCAPFLSTFSWSRPTKGPWCPAALQSVRNWGLECGRDRVTGCQGLEVS